MKIVSLVIIMFFLETVAWAQKNPQYCQRNGRRYSPGQIITENGRQYKCKNGSWKEIHTEGKPRRANDRS